MNKKIPNDEKRFECPNCAGLFKLRRIHFWGKIIRCPECSEVVANCLNEPPPADIDVRNQRLYYMLRAEDLPSNATHISQKNCDPPEMYKGVIVQWDEDHDKRVFGVIDAMPDWVREKLIACQEHEGGIAFIWRDSVPEGYEDGGPGVTAPDNDWWCVMDSKVIHPVWV